MNMSRQRIFSSLVYFHFQVQEIPQVQDGRLAVVEEVYSLLHLGVGHPPCIDDRMSMKAPLVMLKLLPPIFLFHLVQSFRFFFLKIFPTFF